MILVEYEVDYTFLKLTTLRKSTEKEFDFTEVPISDTPDDNKIKFLYFCFKVGRYW